MRFITVILTDTDHGQIHSVQSRIAFEYNDTVALRELVRDLEIQLDRHIHELENEHSVESFPK